MTTLCTVTRHGQTSRHIEGGTPAKAVARALRIHRRILDRIDITDDWHSMIIHWPCGDERRTYQAWTPSRATSIGGRA